VVFFSFLDLGDCWWLPTNGSLRDCDNLNLPITKAFYRTDRLLLLTDYAVIYRYDGRCWMLTMVHRDVLSLIGKDVRNN
jgi:hypothetical protein